MAVTVATFDLDHTLVRRPSSDTQTLKMEAINWAIDKVFGLKQINYMAHIGTELYGMTDRSIMRVVLTNLGIPAEAIDDKFDELFSKILAYFDKNLSSHRDGEYIPLPGVEEFLRKLKGSGISCGLATGNYSRFAQWKLDIVGLSRYFSFGGYGEDADDRDQIVAIALNRSGLKSPDRGCHFGDTPADIKAATANKMLSVAISAEAGGKFPAGLLQEAGADLVLDSYSNSQLVFDLFSRQGL
jgi:phosphoglycolate phosphatase